MRDATVVVDGVDTPLTTVLSEHTEIVERAMAEDPDVREMVVPVEWDVARSTTDAMDSSGLFSSQVTVCRLRDQASIDAVTAEFLSDHDGL